MRVLGRLIGVRRSLEAFSEKTSSVIAVTSGSPIWWDFHRHSTTFGELGSQAPSGGQAVIALGGGCRARSARAEPGTRRIKRPSGERFDKKNEQNGFGCVQVDETNNPAPSMRKIIAAAVWGSGFFALHHAEGQIVVYSDNFQTSQGSVYTTSGNIGSSSWNVARSGEDWGARIDGGVMTPNNDASVATQANGWVYSYQQLSGGGGFTNVLSANSGLLTWTFNMQQIRSNPSGFSSGSYGVAYVIGTSSDLVATQGNGYAVVLGNTGTPDPVRFVSFSGGLSSLGTGTGALITAGGGLANPTNSYMSIRLTYNPAENLWELFGRNDGGAFSDPNTGTLVSFGTATNSAYTGITLTSSGAYWQGSTAAGQTATFGNVSLEVVPEPTTYLMLVVAGGLFLTLFGWRRIKSGGRKFDGVLPES